MSMRMSVVTANVNERKLAQIQEQAIAENQGMHQPKPVLLFIDFDGVICPTGDSPLRQINLPNSNYFYLLDGIAPSNICYSKEMMALFRQWLDTNQIKWFWLTTNYGVTDWYDEILGLDTDKTIALDCLSGNHRRGYNRLKADALLRVIDEPIYDNHQIIWIDDSAATPYFCHKIERAVDNHNQEFLAIQPNPQEGLSRPDMSVINGAIKERNNPCGGSKIYISYRSWHEFNQ